MNRNALCLLVVVIGMLPGSVSTGQTTTQAVEPETANGAAIRGLVAKLSADDYQTRQDAQDQLVRYGAEARPYLRKLLAATNDPEARTRAEAAVAQIEEDRATGASVVTLHVKDAPADQVLAELSRQGMFAIPVMPENLFKQEHVNVPKLTMDFDRQPFWMAMRAFCEKTQLRINAMGGDRKFVVMQGGDDSLLGMAAYSGPFMVVANSVTRSSSIALGRDKTPAKSLGVQISVYAEPKLNVMGHDYYLRLTEATDDRGNSLLIPGQYGAYGSMGQDTSCRWTLGTSLAIPDNLGTRLVRLKGFSRVLMQTKSQTWEVAADAVPTSGAAGPAPAKSIGGRKYVVEELKGTGDAYELKFTLLREGPAGRVEEWQQYGRGVRVSLVDAQGRSLAGRGYNGGGSEEKLTYTYTFARDLDTGVKAGPPVKVVVEVPTEAREVEVPFEFRDVPLP